MPANASITSYEPERKHGRRILLHPWELVAVGVHRHGDPAMPQTLLDDLRVHALAKQQGRAAMPQVVESNVRNLCALDHFAEVSLRDVVSMQRLSARLTEDEIMTCVRFPECSSIAHLYLGP